MCSVQVFDVEGEVKVELTIKLHSHSIQVTVIGMVMYLGASLGYILREATASTSSAAAVLSSETEFLPSPWKRTFWTARQIIGEQSIAHIADDRHQPIAPRCLVSHSALHLYHRPFNRMRSCCKAIICWRLRLFSLLSPCSRGHVSRERHAAWHFLFVDCACV